MSHTPEGFERDGAQRGRDELACLHGGVGPDPLTGAVLPPIHQSTTYALSEVHQGDEPSGGFRYSRTSNPTVEALEARLAAMEGAEHASAYATGMAAISTLMLATLRAGDRVVLSDVVYGGTTRLLRDVLSGFGVTADWVDTTDLDQVRDALDRPAAWVFVETPANPTMKITDLAALGTLARERGVPVVVDNTFMTALQQRPLRFGARAVVYSTTKYLDGHNATTGGAIVTSDRALHERLVFVRNTLGTIQKPFEAWQTLQGLKTLGLRLDRQSRSADEIARFLAAHPAVARVCYPGLEGTPGSAIAATQQNAGGGMLAFELRGGDGIDPEAAGVRCLDALRLWTRAENLGAVESIATHPVSMTHGSVPRDQRMACGITDGLIRLSVGLEPTDALIADLERAIAAALDPAPRAAGTQE